MTRLPKAAAAALMLPLMLTACGSAAATAGTTSAATPAAVNSTDHTDPPTGIGGSAAAGSPPMALPPLLVEIAPGTSTRVKAGLRDTIVFVVPDGTEGSWQATVADPGVAEFVAGGDQGTWIARPSVTPVAPGTTSVTLDGPGGTAEVTVEVVAADHAG